MNRITTAAIVAGLTAVLATPLTAESHIMSLGVERIGMHLDIGLITADADGKVVVYDYSGGEQGRMLGETMVNAGANADVRVPLDHTPSGDVLAILVDNSGNEMAMSVIDLD